MKYLRTIERVIGKFSINICAISMCIIGVMMLIAIFGRLLGSDIEGMFEISQFLLAAATFIGLSYDQTIGAHVKMESVTSRLPKKAQGILHIIAILVCMSLFTLMIWRVGEAAYKDFTGGILVTGLSFAMPMWPHQAGAALGCVLIFIVFLFQLVYAIHNMVSTEPIKPVTIVKGQDAVF